MIILRKLGKNGPALGPRVAAAAVHLLTASGAIWGLLALDAAVAGGFRTALGWLGLALAIDGVDGALARRIGVAGAAGRIDGSLLDNLVDYLNYVFVPAVMISRSGWLPAALAFWGAGLICLTSAFQFAHRAAKTADHFRGFPSCWNIVAAYFLLLDLPAPWAFACVCVLAALALAPIRFVYPSRTRALRAWTLPLTGVWLAGLGVLVARYPTAGRGWAQLSLFFPLYYLTVSLILARRRRD